MTAEYPLVGWRKSSYSAQETNCVEVAVSETVGVRDTKHRLGGQLAVSVAGWSAFVNGLKSTN